MIKKYLLIFTSLAISLGIVSIFPFSAANPTELASNFTGIASRGERQIALIKDSAQFKKDVQTLPEDVIGMASNIVVKKVEAKEEKVVMYKGKRIVVKVFNQDDVVPTPILEFLYQAQLEKENNGNHLSIPNN